MSERRGIVIGTGGHVDHGKTALVHALTGVETDRWQEERERGLTIDLGFAPIHIDRSIETGIVDVPGHEDFLKNMLAGATGIDVLLLVVAADEGPMPQTREHLAIAHLLDIPRGVVALTKCDKVDDEWLQLAIETTRDLLAEHPGREDWRLIPVSSTEGEGLEELRLALREAATGLETRRSDDLFRLPVDRAFSIHGTGTVVTGTVWSGAVDVGATLRLFPGEVAVRVRGLEVHGDARKRVTAGRRCALALVGVGQSEAARGSVLVGGTSWRSSQRLGVRIEMLGGSTRPIEHGQRLRVYLGTREVMARVLTQGRAPMIAGETGCAVLDLETPLVARTRDRAVLRFYSPVVTMGGARVADLDPPSDWEQRTHAWEATLDGSAAEAFRACVGLTGLQGLLVEEAPLRLGRPQDDIETAASETGARRIAARWFSDDACAEAVLAVRDAIARLHEADRRAPGISKEAVRSALAHEAAPELVETAIRQLLEEGGLIESGPRLALPDHAPRLTDSEAAARDRLLEAIQDGGLQPPRIADLGQALRLPRPVLSDLLRLLQEEGHTRAVTPELHLSVTPLDAMAERVRELLADGEAAGPTVFKDAFGLSRKYLIPLLEYLDREGITRRTGEGRVLVQSR